MSSTLCAEYIMPQFCVFVKSEIINFNIFDAPETDEEVEEVKVEEVESEPVKEESSKEETEEEKMEKLEKLRKFKDKNIITEEEFKAKKSQLLGI